MVNVNVKVKVIVKVKVNVIVRNPTKQAPVPAFLGAGKIVRF